MKKIELEKLGYKQIMLYGKETFYYINREGLIYTTRKRCKGFLKPQLNKKGYYCTRLSLNDKRKGFLLYRLIALSFIENLNNYNAVNHIDGNPQNNTIDNLEWCTQSYNCKHSFRIGKSRITEAQRRRIGQQMKGRTGAACVFSKRVVDTKSGVVYESQTEAALALGMKISTLCAMLTGQNKNKTNIILYAEN